jgi:hypothetical protein
LDPFPSDGIPDRGGPNQGVPGRPSRRCRDRGVVLAFLAWALVVTINFFLANGGQLLGKLADRAASW